MQITCMISVLGRQSGFCVSQLSLFKNKLSLTKIKNVVTTLSGSSIFKEEKSEQKLDTTYIFRFPLT